ncbi:unnamed protein product [Durusdinium trenchii]|uniref:Uncharacterized protein n=2 Tax=Durusdinium trenchii TaxID=1381693 RepID=A0ABP0SYM4_9DINO
MGCSSSGIPQEKPKPAGPRDHTHGIGTCEQIAIAEKLSELNKCMIQIGDRSEAECDAPQQQQDFDSWKHQIDASDVEALTEGQTLPMSQWADVQKAKKMNKSLIELVEDPSALKKAVKKRRMALEEVATYRNQLPEKERRDSRSKSSCKDAPTEEPKDRRERL